MTFSESEDKFEEECRSRMIKFLRYGYPDFLLIPENGKPYFVEVKSENDSIRRSQKKMFSFLECHGFEVLISENGEWVERKDYIYENYRKDFFDDWLDKLKIRSFLSKIRANIINTMRKKIVRNGFNLDILNIFDIKDLTYYTLGILETIMPLLDREERNILNIFHRNLRSKFFKVLYYGS